MKKLFFPFFLAIWIGSILYADKSFAQGFTFFEGTYDQLQTRALNADKPYFIFLYANWSFPSKKMFEETFKNKDFISYAEEKYIGMGLDGESIITEGSKLAEKHQVMYFPTVMMFTPQGKLVGKLPGFQSANDLMKALKKYEKEKGGPDLELETKEETTKPIINDGDFFFKVSAKLQAKTGYGVQVAAYSNYRNAFKKLLELEQEKFHKNIHILIQQSESESQSYKVILGPFQQEKQARAYFDLLQKDDFYSGSRVVNLAEL